MNDETILEYCFKDKNGKLHNNICKNKITNMNNEMIQYLNNRFIDSKSLNESVYRIKYNIINRPKCKYCNNEVEYLGKGLFREFCSCKCRGKYNQEKFYEKTGLKSTLLLESVKEKTKQTLLNKYNVDNISKSDIIKNKKKKTFEKHFGYQNNFCNNDILKKAINNSINNINKRIKTNIIKYGVPYYLCLLKGKKLSKEHKNKISKIVSSEDFQKRRNITMKINMSFNKSKFEENIYKELLKYFKLEDIIRQYKSEEYPWNCDFYIKSINTYIEAQGSQFHHFHIFDQNNQNDINELNRMKILSKTKSQYISIIHTWTINDVKKRNRAKENNLNFIEIFPNDNYKEIINNLFNKI